MGWASGYFLLLTSEDQQLNYVTYGLLALCGITTITSFTLFDHAGHEHPKYSYLRIKSKAFPWQCGDCGFFEPECHKKCQEAKKALDE